MLLQILGAVARSEILAVKRRLVALAIGLAGALLSAFALVFAFVALFLWLETQIQPWQAALVVGGILLVLAVLVWLAARLVGRRAYRPATSGNAHVDALLDELGLKSRSDDAPFARVGSALAIGFAIGRGLSR